MEIDKIFPIVFIIMYLCLYYYIFITIYIRDFHFPLASGKRISCREYHSRDNYIANVGDPPLLGYCFERHYNLDCASAFPDSRYRSRVRTQLCLCKTPLDVTGRFGKSRARRRPFVQRASFHPCAFAIAEVRGRERRGFIRSCITTALTSVRY